MNLLRKKLSKCKYILKYACFYVSVKTSKKNILILNTPEYGNLGDQAIAKGEELFIKNYFPGYRIHTISGTEWEKGFSTYIAKKGVAISAKDFSWIFLQGGGFLGDLWPREVNRMEEMMHLFKEGKFIVFPQTCFYQSKDAFNQELKKKNSIYKNKRVLFLAREKNTYELFRNQFKMDEIHCKYVPDIVTYLKPDNSKHKRDGILLCLRGDKEKELDQKELSELLKLLQKKQLFCRYTDTVIPGSIGNNQKRDRELKRKFDEFSSSKLVITDRLHGMVFAAITGTPCLAFDNISRKVSSVYRWIEYLPYVKYKKSFFVQENEIQELLEFSAQSYDQTPLKPYFDEMAAAIRQFRNQ